MPALASSAVKTTTSARRYIRDRWHDVFFVVRQEGVMADAENDDIEPDATAPGADGRSRLMQEVAEQMDAIEVDFGRDYEIGRVITIVEVTGPDGHVGLRRLSRRGARAIDTPHSNSRPSTSGQYR